MRCCIEQSNLSAHGVEVFGSPEQSKEEEATPTATAEVRLKIFEEQSPSNVIAGILSELALQKEVAESELGDRDETDEALSFIL